METRNAMERIVRAIPIGMILILGFVMRCELFHANLSDTLYAAYPSMMCNVEEGEFQQFMNEVMQDSQNTGVSCFLVQNNTESRLEHTITIYTSENSITKKILQKKYAIQDGTYKSLLNGLTKICVLPFTELSYADFQSNPNIGVINITGDVTKLYKQLEQNYTVAYPRIIQSDETDMIVIVWLLIAICVILVSGSSIVRKKKQYMIRVVYGEDLGGLVVKSMLVDGIVYGMLYVSTKIFVNQFCSGDYKPHIACCLYVIGCVIAISLNGLFFKMSPRSVFSNTTENRATLVFLNICKFLAFAVVVFSIATNIDTLGKSLHIIGTDKLYMQYQEDCFMTIEEDSSLINENGRKTGDREKAVAEIWENIYGTEYHTVQPVIAMRITSNPTVVLMNCYAKSLLPGSLQNPKIGDGVTVFYPKSWRNIGHEMQFLLGLYAENSENVDWQMIQYSDRLSVPYIASEDMSVFSEVGNPVIIYCGEQVTFQSTMFQNHQNVIYQWKDAKKIDEALKLSENQLKMVTTNVGEYSVYQMQFVRQMLRFFSSLCIFILLLEIAITITLCNMEFKLHGMEYALKKVYGYSFFNRNRGYIWKSNIGNILLVSSLAIMGGITQTARPGTYILVGFLVICIENGITIAYILYREKQSVRKILKGGCL